MSLSAYPNIIESSSERGIVHVRQQWDRCLEAMVWLEERGIKRLELDFMLYHSYLIEDENARVEFKLTFG